MKTSFLTRCWDFCKTRELKREIFKMTSKDNEMLENYILRSNGTHKILQKYKHRKLIKQERHRYTWFTQFGLHPPQIASPSFLLSSKMKRHNLQQIRCNILYFLSQSHLSISRSENTHLYHNLKYNALIQREGFPSRAKNPKLNIISTIRSSA